MPRIRHFARLFAVILLCLGASIQSAYAIPRLLVDMATGEVLYAEEAGQPWHPASLTKLMTAYVTFRAIEQGRVSLDTPVIMSERALQEPPSKVGLPVGTAMTMQDALYLLIVKSANDVAVAIAETVGGDVEGFVSEMNTTAASMGLTATHYVNPNGLDDDAQVTSARDLAVLALNIRLQYPQYNDLFATTQVELGGKYLPSNNNLLTHFAGTTGMKTGYICSAGLNIVATVERQGRSLMAVVLGGTSSRERGELAAQLFLNGLAGALPGTGQVVTDIANDVGDAPFDMRRFVCGEEAQAYVAARKAAFPMGLEGEQSYLTDDVSGSVHEVHTLGRMRNVPIPKPRPGFAPAAQALVTGSVENTIAQGDGAGISVLTSGRGSVPHPMPRPFHLRNNG